MPIPATDRVVYELNPLHEVVCEFKFPPILRIEAQPPADFQDKLRENYPLYKEGNQAPQLPPVPKEIAPLISQMIPPGAMRRRYEFASEDQRWEMMLTRSSLGFRTMNYSRWEEFKEQIQIGLGALREIYQPKFFSRVGLRYVNVIQRSVLKLKERKWAELLKGYIAGELATDIADDIDEASTEFKISLKGLGLVRVNHGLVSAEENGESEECFLVDNDFALENKVDPRDAIEILDRFNRESGNLFRWCITSTLHDAMRPRKI